MKSSVLDIGVGRALLKKVNDVALAVIDGAAVVGTNGGNGATARTKLSAWLRMTKCMSDRNNNI